MQIPVTWGWGRRKGQEREIQRDTKKLLEVMDMFAILIVVTASGFKTHQAVHFKYEQSTVRQSYLNKTV